MKFILGFLLVGFIYCGKKEQGEDCKKTKNCISGLWCVDKVCVECSTHYHCAARTDGLTRCNFDDGICYDGDDGGCEQYDGIMNEIGDSCCPESCETCGGDDCKDISTYDNDDGIAECCTEAIQNEGYSCGFLSMQKTAACCLGECTGEDWTAAQTIVIQPT